MSAYTRIPTEADLAETRASLRKIDELRRLNVASGDPDAAHAVDADALLLDPRTVAAALSQPPPSSSTPPSSSSPSASSSSSGSAP